MNQELEALKNMAKECNLYIVEAPLQDKRKTTKRYIAVSENQAESPRLSYSELNHFLLGWIKCKKNFSNNSLFEALSYITACNTSDRLKCELPDAINKAKETIKQHS